MIVMRLGSVLEGVVVDAAGEGRDLERVVDDGRAGAQALPALVEQRREVAVHVEVAGRDRQVGRLERAAALLVDDVERADHLHVVAEVGVVAGPPAAVDVGDERRAADGREDDVAATELEVLRGIPGVEAERRGRLATSSSTRSGSRRTRRVWRSTVAPAPARRSIARSPRTSTPISERIRSDARWSDSTSSAERISTGGTGSGRSATAAAESRPTSDEGDAGLPRSSLTHDTPARSSPVIVFPARAGRSRC
jgi:hypothetical protein